MQISISIQILKVDLKVTQEVLNLNGTVERNSIGIEASIPSPVILALAYTVVFAIPIPPIRNLNIPHRTCLFWTFHPLFSIKLQIFSLLLSNQIIKFFFKLSLTNFLFWFLCSLAELRFNFWLFRILNLSQNCFNFLVKNI